MPRPSPHALPFGFTSALWVENFNSLKKKVLFWNCTDP